MLNTSLCYIEKDNKYLMLHRTKKQNDANQDKWIGVGGKFEADETPQECLLREVYEETSLILTSYSLRGVVTFISDEWETEYMFLFTSSEFEGQVSDCDEGELVWIDKNELMNLNLWEGDKIFLKLLTEDVGFFSLKLKYRGDELIEHRIDVN